MENFRDFVEQINKIKEINPSFIIQKKSRFFVDKDEVNDISLGDMVKLTFKGVKFDAEVVALRNGKYELKAFK